MNNNGYQPIRRYKESGKSSSNKYFLIIIITALIVAGLMLFIMSLTGTGMFAPEKKGGPVVTDGETTVADQTTEEETTEEETTAPLPDDDIVYTTIEKTKDDTGYGTLILIDDEHEYMNIGKVSLKNVYDRKEGNTYKLRDTNMYLTAETIDALNKMFADFYKDEQFGDCMVYNAYRNIETQTKLYENNPALAARPGCSDYHTGMSFLLSVIPADGLIYDFSDPKFAGPLAWFGGHAHNYGMIFRYPFNKKSITGYDISGQMRYVGIAHSTYMLVNELCLEEYLTLIAENYKYEGDHLTVACADGYNYEIYYVAAPEEGSVRVPVPQNRDYTISGDNCGGFIITVKMGVNKTADDSATTDDVTQTAPETAEPDVTTAAE